MPKIKAEQLVGTPQERTSQDGRQYKIYQGLYALDGKPGQLIKTFFEPQLGQEYDVDMSTDRDGMLVAKKTKGSVQGSGSRFAGRDHAKEYDYNAPAFALSYVKDLVVSGHIEKDKWFDGAKAALKWLQDNRPTDTKPITTPQATPEADPGKPWESDPRFKQEKVETADGELDLSQLPF